jgi:RNA-binding protein YlmH
MTTEKLETISIAGNRLDAFVARAFRLSRTLAQQAVGQGYVSVNGKLMDKATRSVAVGDVVAVNGYGRASVFSIEEHMKTHRLRVTFAREIVRRREEKK